jgi:hypothetical protein
MKHCNSEICIKIEEFDLPDIENSFKRKIMSRKRPCHLILDASSAKMGFGILKRSGSMQNLFDKYRSYAETLIGSTEIIVSSIPAAFVVNALLKIAKPSINIAVKFQRKL